MIAQLFAAAREAGRVRGCAPKHYREAQQPEVFARYIVIAPAAKSKEPHMRSLVGGYVVHFKAARGRAKQQGPEARRVAVPK